MLHLSFFLILLILVCFPSICIAGATRGLLLWFNMVLPTLFPFFLVTRLILSFNLIPRKISWIYPVITGLIAGYPTGALALNEMLKEKRISTDNGQILMVLCNNASPGFLIGMAGCIYPQNKYLIWLCTIAASITVTFILFILTHKSSFTNTKEPACDSFECIHNSENFIYVLESTIISCAKTLVIIGGYIMIFSIISDLIAPLLQNSGDMINGTITGICEITTGISILCKTAEPIGCFTILKVPVTAFLCSFGGICAIMQTAGAIADSDICLTRYILHKIICAVISGLYVSLIIF